MTNDLLRRSEETPHGMPHAHSVLIRKNPSISLRAAKADHEPTHNEVEHSRDIHGKKTEVN